MIGRHERTSAHAALNPKSRIPLYHQLYDLLDAKIRSGEWKPGDTLPAELRLVDEYAVSRITVRKVLDLLAAEGLILRERGRGTFVTHPQLEHGMDRIVSFTDDMRQRGFLPGTRVLFSGLVFGHFGATMSPEIMDFAREFGLILFV